MSTDSRPDRITAFLADRDAPCPSCGYNLRDSASGACPECGLTLTLGLMSRQTASGADRWWLSSVFGLGIALVIVLAVQLPMFSAVSTLLRFPARAQLVASGVTTAAALPDWWVIARLGLLLTALSAALGWLLLARRRIAHWPAWRRATITLAATLAPLWIIALLNLLTRI